MVIFKRVGLVVLAVIAIIAVFTIIGNTTSTENHLHPHSLVTEKVVQPSNPKPRPPSDAAEESRLAPRPEPSPPIARIYSKYRSFISNSAISKDISIHRVYYDDRRKVSGHSNQLVFFVDASWKIFKADWIIGCGVEDIRAKHFKIRIPAEWYWVGGPKRKRPFQYEHLYVDCYDLPAKPGDRPFLLYKVGGQSKSSEDSPIVVESDYPIIFPEPKVKSKDPNYPSTTVVACIKANSNGAPFMGEILRYQTLIGIDHVSLITLSTYIKDGGLKSLLKDHPSLIEYFMTGYISIDMWKQWYKESKKDREIRLWTESIRKVACSYHYRGTYDFVMPIDTDDFFTPRIQGKTNIKYYLEKYCNKDHVGSCKMKWITYYPEYCGLGDIPTDGNVTKALKSLVNHRETASKSVHKTRFLLDATFHDASRRGPNPCLMPGYKVDHISETLCSVSHMRKFAKPKSMNCTV